METKTSIAVLIAAVLLAVVPAGAPGSDSSQARDTADGGSAARVSAGGPHGEEVATETRRTRTGAEAARQPGGGRPQGGGAERERAGHDQGEGPLDRAGGDEEGSRRRVPVLPDARPLDLHLAPLEAPEAGQDLHRRRRHG